MLDCWDNMFPEAGYTPARLVDLADEYHTVLVRNCVGSVSFAAAAAMAKERCLFFPKVSQILEFHREWASNPANHQHVSGQIEYKPPAVSSDAVALILRINHHGMAKEISAPLAEELVEQILEANKAGDSLAEIKNRLEEAVVVSKQPTVKEIQVAYELTKGLTVEQKNVVMNLPEGERMAAILEISDAESI